MKKQLKRTIKNRYNIAKEDLRILQQMVSKRNVYKGASADNFSRRPKHPKTYFDYIETT
jgi:hypothetical protein